MNQAYVSKDPTSCVQPTILQSGPETARRFLTAHALEHAVALVALLDACHSRAAGDRARALADLAAQSNPNPVAACTLAAQLREDLLDVLCAP